MIKVSAVLSLTSPLHIASPEEARVDPKNGNMFFGGSGVGTPCIRQQTHDVLIREEHQEEEGRSSKRVVIIPANSIRGRLRRIASSVVINHLSKRGEKLTLDAYHTLKAGSANGYPEGKEPTIEEFKKAEGHLFFGIFGGTPRMLPSRLKTDTAYHINDITINGGLVPSSCDLHKTKERCTQVILCRRVDDALTLTDPHIFNVVDNSIESIDKWRKLVASNGTGDLDDEEKSKTRFQGIRSWTAHEIVVPGTTFYFTATLNSYNEAQRGLFLKAIEGFCNLQNIGGQSRNGYGRYQILDAKMTVLENFKPASSSLLKKTVTGWELDRDNEDIDSYLLALDESLEDITAADIESFASYKDPVVAKKIENRKRKALEQAEKETKSQKGNKKE